MENQQVEKRCKEMEIKGREVLIDKAIDEVKKENHEEGKVSHQEEKQKEERKEVNCSFYMLSR
jgi:hypothetical protein